MRAVSLVEKDQPIVLVIEPERCREGIDRVDEALLGPLRPRQAFKLIRDVDAQADYAAVRRAAFDDTDPVPVGELLIDAPFERTVRGQPFRQPFLLPTVDIAILAMFEAIAQNVLETRAPSTMAGALFT